MEQTHNPSMDRLWRWVIDHSILSVEIVPTHDDLMQWIQVRNQIKVASPVVERHSEHLISNPYGDTSDTVRLLKIARQRLGHLKGVNDYLMTIYATAKYYRQPFHE